MGITQLNVLEAGLIALSGLVIVFIMLACLSGIIVGISKIINRLTLRRDIGMVSPTMHAQKVVQPTTPVLPAPVELLGVDDLTAACIMAIVSDKLGVAPEELQFQYIKAL